jgi:Na+-transporting NADH:ubiquinone oxidoreductase subunit NqrC
VTASLIWLTNTVTSGLTELLQKDATAHDPGRVVNISSVAGNDPIASDTGLASRGQGLWSCMFSYIFEIKTDILSNMRR